MDRLALTFDLEIGIGIRFSGSGSRGGRCGS